MAFGLWSSGLVAFSVIMGVGTYLTGLLALVPQTCNGAQGGKIAESVGAGVLVGSCFCLILPEGFVSFLEAEDSLPEFLMGGAVLLGFLVMMLTQAISEALGNEEEVGGRKVRMTTDTQEGPSADIELVRGEMGATTSACATFSPASDSSTIRRTLPLERDFLLGRSRERSDAPSSPTGHTPVAQLPKQVLSGLLIHAAADGVAVGAASLSTNVSLTASVILAICLHKGPVSYGLTSYLRSAGLAGSMLQKGLIVFSAMTPLVAMLTYLLLSMLPGMNKQSHVALVLLFSGGAVLFVACVHILPTAMGQSGAHSHSFGVDTQTTESMRAVRLKRLAALTLGTLIPLIRRSGDAPYEPAAAACPLCRGCTSCDSYAPLVACAREWSFEPCIPDEDECREDALREATRAAWKEAKKAARKEAEKAEEAARKEAEKAEEAARKEAEEAKEAARKEAEEREEAQKRTFRGRVSGFFQRTFQSLEG
eukprot:gene15372-21456_t